MKEPFQREKGGKEKRKREKEEEASMELSSLYEKLLLGTL